MTPDAAAMPDNGYRRVLAPFRHVAYRRLALALVLSTFASGVWAVAIVWEVIRFGGGPGDLSTVAASGAVGVILPALLGGVVADRLPQKQILLAVAALQVLGMGVGVLLSAGDLDGVLALSVLSFVLGAGMAFYYPAYSSWLPWLVPATDLQAVNGFEGMVRPGLQQALGPAVAGAAVASFAPAAAMGIAATASVFGFVALLLVPARPRAGMPSADPRASATGSEPGTAAGAGTGAATGAEAGTLPDAPRSVFQDVRVGVSYLVRTPWLLATLLFAALMLLVMMGPMEVLIPFLVKDHLGGGPRDHSYVLAAFGIGGALGSLVMGSRRMPRRYLTIMNLMWGAGCLPFILIGSTTHIWVIVACGLVMGAMFSAPMVIWGTLLQRRVPPHLLGRVASLDFFVSISLMPVSMALAGRVSAWLGLQRTFLIAGTAPLVIAIIAILAARLPADEITHPLDRGADAPDPAQTAGVSADNQVTRP